MQIQDTDRKLVRNATNWRLANVDGVAFLDGLDAESVDLIVTDPPYESLEKHRAIGTTTRLKHSKSSSNDWFAIFPNRRFDELFKAAWRVLRKNTHFYLFCDQETMFIAKPAAEAAGFRFWKPIVWDKLTMGMGYHYRARYEFILFFEKGKRQLNSRSISDVLPFKRIYGGYPTEKPVALMKILVEQSTKSGDVVIDPFMGAGAVGIAAILLGRSFFGNDSNEEAVQIAEHRIREFPYSEAAS